ncbi:inorganic diphosphatase [Winogradskyella vidalii]|uniref:inorganic diphosphatase n=1 Tax=Winogradskyella vidalii TaxID=2615024 RepID=UPI0015CDFEFA|nr:inorganic diphosphatase [Winogradskyella vidalii]
MLKNTTLLLFTASTLLFINCHSEQNNKTSKNSENKSEAITPKVNLLTDIEPRLENGDVNAIIEIPAGTLDKWELNKATGNVEWEMVNNQPRVVNYISYPGNYGMIPKTLLSKEKGGDGDPLDILVLGPPVERGQILKCKVIGVLYLTDRGEQDDKLIAVSRLSTLYRINSIEELNNEYNGVSEIVQLWFTNYKGPNKMESKGFGSKKAALEILTTAIDKHQLK